MSDAPNAPAPASAPEPLPAMALPAMSLLCVCGHSNYRHTFSSTTACYGSDGTAQPSCDCRAFVVAPVAAPPASPPTAEERAEWRKEYADKAAFGYTTSRIVMRLLDALEASESAVEEEFNARITTRRLLELARTEREGWRLEVERLDAERVSTPAPDESTLAASVAWLAQQASVGGPSSEHVNVVLGALRARTPATTAPDATWEAAGIRRVTLVSPPAEPSADAANEVKRLADEAIKTAFVSGAWNGTGSRPEREYEGPARASHTARDGLHAAIDALADTSSVTSYTRTLERENAKLRDKLAARAPTVTAAEGRTLLDPATGVTITLTAEEWARILRLAAKCQPAATAEPLCERCRLPMGPPGMRMLGPNARYCSVECVDSVTAEPPAVALGAEGMVMVEVRELRAEVAFYAGRTLEAEADAADWKRKAEDAEREVARLRGIETVMKAVNDNHRAACVSIALYEAEVAALRADRDRDAKGAARWRAVRIVDMPRYFADWNEMGTEGRDIFADSLIDEAAARQSPAAGATAPPESRPSATPASAPQPDVWYRSTIRPSSIPYLTRSIREIDEP